MKVFKSRRDVFTTILFLIGIILCFIVLFFSIIIAITQTSDMFAMVVAVMCVGIAGLGLASIGCNLVRTDYTFFEDCFQVRGGFAKKQFSYKQIYALQRCKKLFCLNALAREKFEIIYRGEGPRVYISPENEELFIKELKKYCKNLQIRN